MSASGFASAQNLVTFLKDAAPGTPYAIAGQPTAAELGTETPAATKLVAKANKIPGIVTLGTIDKQANSLEFFIYGEDSSERIPGIASTQQFNLGFAMKYPGTTANDIFAKWYQKVPGDYIEGAIITATGTRGAANAITGLTRSELSLAFFHGNISGTSLNLGTQSDPAQMSLTIDLIDPVHIILDAD